MRSRSANLTTRSSDALLKCHRPDLIHRPGDGTLLRTADVWTRPNLQSPFAIIAGIVASGIGTDAGIAEALNARGIATARGGRWHAQTVKNVRARSARLAAEGEPCA